MAGAGTVLALGLMSGTSLDGIDAALVETDGVSARPIRSEFFPYTAERQDVLRAALMRWPDPRDPVLVDAATVVMACHAAAISAFPEAEVVGFHGQTLAHEPHGWRTHQLGDGADLARRCGRPVVWDFRTADVLSGGEGAPLVPAYHFELARKTGNAAPLAFVNIGGVANVTWISGNAATAEARGALLAFDTGPGNALINDYIKLRCDREMDAGGELAAEGRVCQPLVDQFLGHEFFAQKPPKSLDRNMFLPFMPALEGLSTEDGLATLTAITAQSIAAATHHMPEPPVRWLICGGGRKNRTIINMLSAATNAPVAPVEQVGLDGDMLEAEAFAYLAVRVLRGLPTSFPGSTGCRVPVCGGRVSQP